MLEQIVYIVEDDNNLNQTLVELLSSVNIICQPFINGFDFLAALPSHARGCVILDIRLPGIGGLLLQQELLVRKQRLPIIFITGYADVEIAVDAMKKGAFDFLKKPFQSELLIKKVQKALDHDSKYNVSNIELKKRFDKLTVKQHAVLKRIKEGKTNREIAYELEIVIKTVEAHRVNIMQKIGAKNVADLIKLCLKAEHVSAHDNRDTII